MLFKIKITSGEEVKWAGMPYTGNVYYGGPPPESGEWKIPMTEIEDYFEPLLKDLSYGDAIETFVLGFEIADLEGWGNFFTSKSRYTSHRPKMKLIISVGQLNWPDVKDLPAKEQFQKFSEILLDAILRVREMKRKPRNFDALAFSTEIARLLADFPVVEME